MVIALVNDNNYCLIEFEVKETVMDKPLNNSLLNDNNYNRIVNSFDFNILTITTNALYAR